jgi:hypothetical protein
MATDPPVSRTLSKRQLRHVAFGGGRRIAGTVYGTVIVMSTIVAGSADHAGWDLTTLVASTALVIWIAHVYAHELGESIEGQYRLNLQTLRKIAVRQLPILAAALVPTVMLSLGAAGILRENRAIWGAIGVGLVTLGIQGARYARVERLGALGSVTVVAINLALGCAVVGLKVFAEY